jgi:serine O-acetyltransferase
MIKTTVSAEVPDWERERALRPWDPPRRLLGSIRRYQHWRQRAGLIARLVQKASVLEHRFWSVVTASDIPLNGQLGGGLVLLHPTGVVVHPEAVVGPNCVLMQQVTLVGGVRLGGHVDIGAGAKVVRPVTIGAHAKIGANAVVLNDVPAGATVVGVPARVVRQDAAVAAAYGVAVPAPRSITQEVDVPWYEPAGDNDGNESSASEAVKRA